MSELTQQLEQLKNQQQEIYERIRKEEERKFKPRSHKEIYGDKVAPMSRQEKMEIWERFWAEKGLKFS